MIGDLGNRLSPSTLTLPLRSGLKAGLTTKKALGEPSSHSAHTPASNPRESPQIPGPGTLTTSSLVKMDLGLMLDRNTEGSCTLEGIHPG